MPQASTETLNTFTGYLKEHIVGDHVLLEACAVIVLRENFKQVNGVIRLENRHHPITALERSAIDYLIEEWDYAYEDA